ncbi:hypothetical protein MMC14_010273 [Varicellaria rhodocarpa]|nr:hypothetical protein [Varicellaria rhodocarpa]
MSSDFVPITLYQTDHVVVGIGQRYHVVVEAAPYKKDEKDNKIPHKGNEYWIRTIPADGCSEFELGDMPDERQGMLYYDHVTDAVPTTVRAGFSLRCRDEPFASLTPVLPWAVKQPSKKYAFKENQNLFKVGLESPDQDKGRPLPNNTFAHWAIGSDPLWLDFSNPTIINLNNTQWKDDLVVIPKDYPEDSWIYIVITSNNTNIPDKLKERRFVGAAHPQSDRTFSINNLDPKYDNPPRRDVALLPANGFIVIAFKADNPGSWLLHCHIAWHASSGLGLQVLQRQEAIDKEMTKERLNETTRVCKSWDTWVNNPW